MFDGRICCVGMDGNDLDGRRCLRSLAMQGELYEMCLEVQQGQPLRLQSLQQAQEPRQKASLLDPLFQNLFPVHSSLLQVTLQAKENHQEKDGRQEVAFP